MKDNMQGSGSVLDGLTIGEMNQALSKMSRAELIEALRVECVEHAKALTCGAVFLKSKLTGAGVSSDNAAALHIAMNILVAETKIKECFESTDLSNIRQELKVAEELLDESARDIAQLTGEDITSCSDYQEVH